MPTAAAATKQRTLLLVEDDALIALNEERLLQEHGYGVKTVRTGEAAITAAVDESIDLILMDIDLGPNGVDGTEAAARILKRREMPIVFLTSHSENEIVERVRGITRYGYVLKSAGEFVLLQAIETAFELFDVHLKAVRENEIRREAENQASSNEALYKNLMENSIDAVYLLSETGAVLNANGVACKMLGYSRDELLTLTIDDIDPNYPSQKFVDFWRDQPKSASLLFDTQHKTKSGRLLDVEVNGIFFFLHGEKQLFGVARDTSRRRVLEESLRRNEAMYRRYFQNTPSLILEMDADTKEILSCNAAMARSLGMSPDEVIGLSASCVFRAAVLQERVAAVKRSIANDEVFSCEEARDGRHYRVTYVPAGDGSRRLVLAIGVDITELVETQHHLAEERSNFRNLAEDVGLGIAVLQDGVITFANRMVAQLAGVSAEQLRAAAFGELLMAIHPADRQRVTEAYASRFTRPARGDHDRPAFAPIEYRQVRPDGRVIWIAAHTTSVSYDGKPAFAVVLEDVSESKQIAEAGKVGLWDWDLRSNEVAYSTEWKRQIGYQDHEISDDLEEFRSRVHPDDQEWLAAAVQDSIEHKAEDHAVRFRFRHKDGSYRWILANASVTTDEHGNAVRMRGSHTDITELRETEDELRRTIASKELLMRELNHRVKNNLLLVAALIALKDGELGPETDLSDLRSRVASIQTLYALLQESADPGSVALGPYLRDVANNAFSVAEHAIATTVQVDDTEVPVQKAVSLGLIVNELAINAMKHGFAGASPARFDVMLTQSGTRFTLTISNSGNPLPKAASFENAKTFGFGLVSTLVEQLNGTLETTRAPSPVFTIQFPADTQ